MDERRLLELVRAASPPPVLPRSPFNANGLDACDEASAACCRARAHRTCTDGSCGWHHVRSVPAIGEPWRRLLLVGEPEKSPGFMIRRTRDPHVEHADARGGVSGINYRQLPESCPPGLSSGLLRVLEYGRVLKRRQPCQE